jgi:hypothetical protein
MLTLSRKRRQEAHCPPDFLLAWRCGVGHPIVPIPSTWIKRKHKNKSLQILRTEPWFLWDLPATPFRRLWTPISRAANWKKNVAPQRAHAFCRPLSSPGGQQNGLWNGCMKIRSSWWYTPTRIRLCIILHYKLYIYIIYIYIYYILYYAYVLDGRKLHHLMAGFIPISSR